MEFWRFIKGFEGAVSARLAQPTAAAAAGVRLAAAKRAHLVWEFVPRAIQEFTSTKFKCDLCFALLSFHRALEKTQRAHTNRECTVAAAAVEMCLSREGKESFR